MYSGSVKKTCLLAALVLIMLAAPAAWAQEQNKVAVFPFQIFSSEPLSHLSLDLQKMLADRLAKEGVGVIDSGQVNQALRSINQPLDLALARKLADQLGAEFAVYGSLTKIGARVSIDVKVLDVLGIRRPQTVFSEGVGIDSLPDMSNKLAREVAVLSSGREQVADIEVVGAKRIEAEAVKAVMKTKAGGPFSMIRLDDDLKRIWNMGYFEDVRLKTRDTERGKIVIVDVKEKPSIKEIRIVGAKELDPQDIKDDLGIKPFGVYKPVEIKEADQKIVEMYRNKGYYDVQVTDTVKDLPSGDKSITFNIDEGKKVLISKIEFEGNKSFDSDELEDLMSTQGEGWFTWITDANVLESAKLEQDINHISDFYYNHGFMRAKVGDPQITRGEDGLIITIKIVEGNRFKVGSLDVQGEMIVPKEKLIEGMKTKVGEWYNRQNLRADIMDVNTRYSDQGFAYVEVRPQIKENDSNYTVDITLDIKKGIEVYFENILITGNSRTRDYVIRRELSAAEGDMFSGTAIRNANLRLRRLNFFEDVQVTTTKGSAADKMNLGIKVKEKRTGQISLGAGYSTQDSFMVMGSISESNLFGRGQTLELKGQVGGKSTRYTISFTEPWLFDRPISFGIDIYDWEREYIDYDKEAIGGRLRWGFPTPLYATRFYLYYKYEEANITDISDSASVQVQDQAGWHTTSSVRAMVRRDTRNKAINADEGSDNSISVEYAGGPLGGTNYFTKVIGDTGWYFPLWWETVFVAHGRIGWLTQNSGGDLPMYEKFYLGGINTLRGFDYLSVSPMDANGDRIGGEHMLLFNFEYRFPLVPKAGLSGVVFFDTGNVWTKDEGYQLGDMRQSVGAGIRWMSPIGPLRLEYGYVLDPEPGDDDSNWEFTIGSMF